MSLLPKELIKKIVRKGNFKFSKLQDKEYLLFRSEFNFIRYILTTFIYF